MDMSAIVMSKEKFNELWGFFLMEQSIDEFPGVTGYIAHLTSSAHHYRADKRPPGGPKLCDCVVRNGIKCDTLKCKNRASKYECSARCGEECTNRAMQKMLTERVAPPIRIGASGILGFGIFATADIPAGTLLGAYFGVNRLTPTAAVSSKYAFEIFDDLAEDHKRNARLKKCIGEPGMGYIMVDAALEGNWTRFVNHSCEPNVDAVVYIVDDRGYIGLVSKKGIAEGQELFVNYGEGFFDDLPACLCNTKSCIEKKREAEGKKENGKKRKREEEKQTSSKKICGKKPSKRQRKK